MTTKNIKIGDKVRYLNAVGGGIVRKFKDKNIILVEEEDGFETPILINEVVVVQPTNQYNFPVETPPEPTTVTQTNTPAEEIKMPEYTWNERYETAEGNLLSLYLAFVPRDIKKIQTTDMELFLINDSNYYIQFILSSGTTTQSLRYTDTIEPQTKLFIENIDKLMLNDISDLRFQGFAYKKIPYSPKPTIDAPIHIKGDKFYKLHSFTDNDFFDEKAFITTIIKNDILNFGEQIDPVRIQKAIQQKTVQEKKPTSKRSNLPQTPLEIDLHINQLLDNTSGLSNADMLSYQLKTFERVMDENIKIKGREIIFIHGKGEGRLRAEIEKILKHKYKHCQYYDASFQQYGFGATKVIIH